MKNSKAFTILVSCLLGIFIIFNACEKADAGIDNKPHTLSAEISAKDNKPKINACHNNHLINVSINAVAAHRGHGDAIDMDGDGYFDIDNPCSETDCDDTDPARTPDSEGNCHDDEDGVSNMLIGTWTTSIISVATSVDGQSTTDYLIDVLGMSPADAAALNASLLAALEAQVTGALTLNSDNTYESSFGGGSDSGTWSLSADEMTLTLFEGPDIIEITINAITETTWNATIGDVLALDLDSDPSTPPTDVTVEATVTLLK